MSEMPEMVKAVIADFRGDSVLLQQMCCSYPGDPSGELMRDSFIYDVIADHLGDMDWDKIMTDYEANRPKVTITLYDAKGNIESESTG